MAVRKVADSLESDDENILLFKENLRVTSKHILNECLDRQRQLLGELVFSMKPGSTKSEDLVQNHDDIMTSFKPMLQHLPGIGALVDPETEYSSRTVGGKITPLGIIRYGQ